MASARFVEPPDELRACSEAFHAEAMKHLDAVFDEGSYGELHTVARELTSSRTPSHPLAHLVLPLEP